MKPNNKVLGLLGLARRAGKIAFGTESTIEVIEKKKTKLVIIAKDSSDRTKKNFKDLCEKYNVQIREIETIETLSKSIGQFNKAVYAIKDENFAKEIIKIIDGGEIIG